LDTEERTGMQRYFQLVPTNQQAEEKDSEITRRNPFFPYDLLLVYVKRHERAQTGRVTHTLWQIVLPTVSLRQWRSNSARSPAENTIKYYAPAPATSFVFVAVLISFFCHLYILGNISSISFLLTSISSTT